MNKAELVQAMADETGLSKSDAEKALNAFVEVVGGELGKGGKSILQREMLEHTTTCL